jgi:hypothetical protein
MVLLAGDRGWSGYVAGINGQVHAFGLPPALAAEDVTEER